MCREFNHPNIFLEGDKKRIYFFINISFSFIKHKKTKSMHPYMNTERTPQSHLHDLASFLLPVPPNSVKFMAVSQMEPADP